jgi:hypothetical protein
MTAVFVDLDRTLLHKTSTLLEIKHAIRSEGILATLKYIKRARPKSKRELKQLLTVREMGLDYRPYFCGEVLSMIVDLRAKGSKIILATGSSKSVACRVELCYPLKFDEILASTADNKLKGVRKLEEIHSWLEINRQSYFIYFGDAWIDLKIMKNSESSVFFGRKWIYWTGKYIFRIKQISFRTCVKK